jgi:hypothetical protein
MKHILSILTIFVLAGCSLPNAHIDSPVPPFVAAASASLNLIDVGRLPAAVDTTIVVTATVQRANVTMVTAMITAEDGSAATYELLDNGAAPDVKAHDGIYAGSVHLHLTKASVGQYTIQVQASGDAGLGSNILALPVSIISSNNRPPVISQLIAPDTAFVPTGTTANSLLLSVAAADSDGLASIASVTVTLQRPDSSIVGTYELYDDGSLGGPTQFNILSGDATAGDGRFTLTIPVPRGTVTGEYRDFLFSAKDKSGAISNTLTKRIYFK